MFARKYTSLVDTMTVNDPASDVKISQKIIYQRLIFGRKNKANGGNIVFSAACFHGDEGSRTITNDFLSKVAYSKTAYLSHS